MELFKNLAAIYSGSGQEKPMRKYIRRWVNKNIPEALITTDNTGNMYITKGVAETYPCVVAHLDQVQKRYPSDYKVCETKEIIFAYSKASRSHCGLGADDKCGIWIALKMLKKHDAIKVAFFPGEEIGCIGSSAADMTFFDDVKFVVEPDRRGAFDLITSICGIELASDAFLKAINATDFGYKETSGMMTDVEILKSRGLNVSCINMSCGYYSPHTENEYVDKRDMINALNFVDNIITNCTDVYLHEYTEPVCSWRSRGGRTYNSWNDMFDWRKDSKRSVGKSVKDYMTPKEKALEKDVFDDYRDEWDTWEQDRWQYEWDEQYDEARNFIASELAENPNYNAKDLLDSYGSFFDLLSIDDIEAIFDDLKDEIKRTV